MWRLLNLEYKKIIINNEETSYRLYIDGRLMNEKTGKYYKGTLRNGYRVFSIRWNKKKYFFSQHRLLGELFLENPNCLEYIHHINGDRLDNRLENLKWVSATENNLQINNPLSLKDHKDYLDYDLSQEEWRTFRNTYYMVSNLGRVKNCKTQKIIKGKITDGGYREYCLTFNKKKYSIRAHRLVWEVWVGKPQQVINHINGNKLDNRLTNLEDISNQENNLKAIYETQTHKFKKTACFDKEGNLIRIFMNNADAARAMNIKPQSIQNAIKKGYCSCGYYWKNLEEEEKV